MASILLGWELGNGIGYARRLSDIADRTHWQTGLVNYTHPASRIDDLYKGAYAAKGLPIYAALGKIDTMDIAGSGDQASS